MDDTRTVLDKARRIESLLQDKFGAIGKGLHEKLTSVEINIDASCVQDIRRIATIRNRTVHEDGYCVSDLDTYIKDCERVTDYLSKIGAQVQPVAIKAPINLPDKSRNVNQIKVKMHPNKDKSKAKKEKQKNKIRARDAAIYKQSLADNNSSRISWGDIFMYFSFIVAVAVVMVVIKYLGVYQR